MKRLGLKTDRAEVFVAPTDVPRHIACLFSRKLAHRPDIASLILSGVNNF